MLVDFWRRGVRHVFTNADLAKLTHNFSNQTRVDSLGIECCDDDPRKALDFKKKSLRVDKPSRSTPTPHVIRDAAEVLRCPP
jgi:hypothetical protein